MSDPNETRSPSPDVPATPAGAEPAATRFGAEPGATASGSSAPTFADASPPASAGRYALGAEIARGGMGAVYRAIDTAFDREVAVKVLLDKYDTRSGTARRFHDEARITGQLQHPGIPPVHDLGTLPDGRPFLAMKLIKGETLDELLKARSDPSAERGRFVAIFEQVCQALAYAHAHDVIHRDLKPSNVMVGNFAEVQVMDWGLAKVLTADRTEETDPDETAGGTAIQSIRETDSAFTQAGSVLGTPAYMPPEQAIGAIHKVNARSDVFGLGAILAVILTGKPPFAASSVETTRLQAAQGNVEECFARLDASGAEPELVALCKKCLSKKSEDRPADAKEVATAVAELRAAADERARQAELDRVKAEGDKVAAELRVEGERQKAEEQRKRRRVQLALAGFVILVAVGGGIATVQVQRQREQDRIATERQTRAASLVDSLVSADTAAVPRIVTDLADLRDLTRPKLMELAGQSVTTRSGLHARLALLPDEPHRAAELAAYIPQCKPEELLTIRDALKPQAAVVAPGLWAVLLDTKTDAGKRVRAACALAGLTPADERWAAVAGDVVGVVVKENPLLAAVWATALEPVRAATLPALVKWYSESRSRIESGKLTVTDIAAEATALDLTANLLARYPTDRPTELAELAMTADGRHVPLFANAIQARRETVAPLLEAEIDRKLPANLPSIDDKRETLAKRQANAAVALLRLNQPTKVWPLLKHSPDPRVRSYLIHRLSPLGADAKAIVGQLEATPDITIRRALLLSLGEFGEADFTPDERAAVLPKVQEMYRTASDPGLHAAAEWLLRTWKQEAWLIWVNDEWAKDKEQRHKRLEGIRRTLAMDRVKALPQWYVNGQGQTMVVIPGPREFVMGSPMTESGRQDNETQHRRRIGRTFALAAKSVTLEQYRRFDRGYQLPAVYSRTGDLPVVGISWFQAAAYCNWLSKEEGIPEDQWCYETDTRGEVTKLKANYLRLTGYRLPSEAEMEVATRAGAVTSRHYGETEDLLSKYGWYMVNSKDQPWPVGRLKPNDLGLFDSLGNAFTWCQEVYKEYPQSNDLTVDEEGEFEIVGKGSGVLRGGSSLSQASLLRSAYRDLMGRTTRIANNGFRVARTLP